MGATKLLVLRGMIIKPLDTGNGYQLEWESEQEKSVLSLALLILGTSYPPGNFPKKISAGSPMWRALQGAPLISVLRER
jgi:hypothetical protein